MSLTPDQEHAARLRGRAAARRQIAHSRRVQPTLTGDRPAVTFPAVKAGRQLVLFDARQEGERDAADLAAGLETMRAAGDPPTCGNCGGPTVPFPAWGGWACKACGTLGQLSDTTTDGG